MVCIDLVRSFLLNYIILTKKYGFIIVFIKRDLFPLFTLKIDAFLMEIVPP